MDFMQAYGKQYQELSGRQEAADHSYSIKEAL